MIKVSTIFRKYSKSGILWLLFIHAYAQVPVSPIVQPHVNFVDTAGNPCATCTLQSFLAGTSTPTPTYTDATGVSQNPNPIILDAAGGANIWMSNLSYKFILKAKDGTTIWSVDQVRGGGGLGGVCGPYQAIQIANGTVNGLTCDPAITINPATHTLNVGTLPANHVTIGALSTPTSWSFDTTSAATALASLGGTSTNAGTANQIAYYAANGTTLSGTNALPDGTTATTQTASDNSTKIATTAYVAFPGALNPNQINLSGGSPMTDNQGDGTKIQHSSGSVVANNCSQFDVSGNIVDAGAPCYTGVSITQTDQTSSRLFGVIYKNLTGHPIMVQGYLITSAGGADGNVNCSNGSTGGLGSTPFSENPTATDAGGSVEFHLTVPTDWFYECNASGTMTPSLVKWYETTLQ